jgi:hypothetical protein
LSGSALVADGARCAGGAGGPFADERARRSITSAAVGQERPEELKAWGAHREQLEPNLHAVVLGEGGQRLGIGEPRSPVAAWMSIGGRPVRSACNGVDDRVVGRMAGQVGRDTAVHIFAAVVITEGADFIVVSRDMADTGCLRRSLT